MAEHLEIEQLGKVYPGGTSALADVSLEVEPGTFLVLLGPSGSGKTTLLRAVAGIEKITSGRISIGGRLVADGKTHVPPERRDLSMVFQDYTLWPHLSVRDNVAFALKRRGLARPEAQRQAGTMLTRVGLDALATRYPSELSGGEQQRVALARALVGDTGLVLCDEPLSNLDADLRERMRVRISSLVRSAGATTIYITHDQSEAFALADRVGVLERGRLVQLGTPEEIYERPSSPFVARFTGLAGELPVQISDHPDSAGRVEVRGRHLVGSREVRVHLGSTSVGELEGLLVVRPTAIRLADTNGTEHDLRGQVVDVAFRGRGYEHTVALDPQTQISGILSPERVGRGKSVGLTLDRSGCLVFPEPMVG